jgi:hypothetical protein
LPIGSHIGDVLRVPALKGEGSSVSIGCVFLLRNFGKRAPKDPLKRREQSTIWKTGF